MDMILYLSLLESYVAHVLQRSYVDVSMTESSVSS